MIAIEIREPGGPDVLVPVERPTPAAAAGEVLIRVAAAGVNPLDFRIRSGGLKLFLPVKRPFVPGTDVAGVVETAGPGATRFAVGDRVFAMLPAKTGGGYAQFAVVDESLVTPMPGDLSMTDAAATPLAALTALQALRDKAEATAGAAVLINGASGGVGSFAVQIAKAMKLHVTATASGKNADFVRSLGADAIVDYTAGLDTLGPRFDVVFDAVDKLSFKQARRLLKPGGVVVSTNPLAEALALNVLAPFRGGKKLRSLFVKPSGEQLREIAGWIGELKVRPQVERTFPLASADEAHRVGETGRTRGKLVLIVDDAPSHRPATSA